MPSARGSSHRAACAELPDALLAALGMFFAVGARVAELADDAPMADVLRRAATNAAVKPHQVREESRS